jgi:pimeloyl-ACP methyl ester carboxylesterase
LLVGHSYGGVVITEFGSDSKVAGLVYVAAFAPDAGESLRSLGGTVAPRQWGRGKARRQRIFENNKSWRVQ